MKKQIKLKLHSKQIILDCLKNISVLSKETPYETYIQNQLKQIKEEISCL